MKKQSPEPKPIRIRIVEVPEGKAPKYARRKLLGLEFEIATHVIPNDMKISSVAGDGLVSVKDKNYYIVHPHEFLPAMERKDNNSGRWYHDYVKKCANQVFGDINLGGYHEIEHLVNSIAIPCDICEVVG